MATPKKTSGIAVDPEPVPPPEDDAPDDGHPGEDEPDEPRPGED